MELLLQPRGDARHLAHELALDALHVHVTHGLRALAQLELLRLETQLDQLLPRVCQCLLRLRRREGSGIRIGSHACLGPYHLEVREISLGKVLEGLLILLEHRHHALVARVRLGRDLGRDLARQQAATPAAAAAVLTDHAVMPAHRIRVRSHPQRTCEARHAGGGAQTVERVPVVHVAAALRAAPCARNLASHGLARQQQQRSHAGAAAARASARAGAGADAAGASEAAEAANVAHRRRRGATWLANEPRHMGTWRLLPKVRGRRYSQIWRLCLRRWLRSLSLVLGGRARLEHNRRRHGRGGHATAASTLYACGAGSGSLLCSREHGTHLVEMAEPCGIGSTRACIGLHRHLRRLSWLAHGAGVLWRGMHAPLRLRARDS